MNVSDDGRNRDGDATMSQAQPYQTPPDVADTPAGRQWFRTPLAWIAALGAVVFVGGALAFTSVSRETQDFGGSRLPIDDPYEAPMEEEAAEYEVMMSAAQAIQE